MALTVSLLAILIVQDDRERDDQRPVGSVDTTQTTPTSVSPPPDPDLARPLFFTVGGETAYDLQSVRLDGTGFRDVVDGARSGEVEIALNSAGDSIVGCAYRDAPWSVGTTYREMFVFDTHTGRRAEVPLTGYECNAPSWLPDGRVSFLCSARPNETGWRAGLCIVNPAQPGDVPALLLAADGITGRAAWTPDGRHFIVSVSVGQPSVYSLWVGTAAGQLLHEVAGPGFDPAISPDGRQLAFTKTDGGSGDSEGVHVMPIVDGFDRVEPQRVTTEGFNPAWSPSGRQLAYVINSRAPDGPRQVTVKAPGTGRETVVFEAPNSAGVHQVVW